MRILAALALAASLSGCISVLGMPESDHSVPWQPADVRYAPGHDGVTKKDLANGFDEVMNTLAFIGDGIIRTGFEFTPR